MPKRKRATRQKPEDWYPAFLASLGATGNVLIACRQAGIARTTAYRHQKGNSEFAREWGLAMEDAGDALEAEARRRAVSGVRKTRYLLYKGEPVIDWNTPGTWVDDQGQPWQEGTSGGRKRWTGAFLVEEEIRYSDALMTLLLKGAKPEKYADRMKLDQGAVTKEAEKAAELLGVSIEDLVAEIKAIQAEAGSP